jgi:hypothetical protein
VVARGSGPIVKSHALIFGRGFVSGRFHFSAAIATAIARNIWRSSPAIRRNSWPISAAPRTPRQHHRARDGDKRQAATAPSTASP